MNVNRLLVIALLGIYSAGLMAAGNLNISQSEIILTKVKDEIITLENTGDSVLYINVRQELLVNPGASPERLIDVGDVSNPALLIGPQKLVLMPNQKRNMLVNRLKTPTDTQVWRITFSTVEKIAIEANQPESHSTPIMVNIGYGVVIYQKGYK